VSLTAAGLAAFPLWKRERRDARLARALLGNLVGDKAWKTIEGRLEAKSPAPSTREVNVTWSVRRAAGKGGIPKQGEALDRGQGGRYNKERTAA